VPSCLEVKRVYDVCQYIFSGEGEYALDIHHIFSQQKDRKGTIKDVLGSNFVLS
jgi:hypothetical protein